MMEDPIEADEPEDAEPSPAAACTSDLDFDFGAPVLADGCALLDRWRARHIETERSLRLDVLQAAGLAG